MKYKLRLISVLKVLLFTSCYGQEPIIKKLDSLDKKADTAGQVNIIDSSNYTTVTQLTTKTYFKLLGNDFKQVFTKPFHMKDDWGTLGIMAGATFILSFADKPIQKFAFDFREKNKGVRDISHYVTRFGGLYEIYTLLAFEGVALVTKNKKMQTTTLLATQSYVVSAAVQTVVKFLAGRARPYVYNNDAFANPSFYGPFTNKLVDKNGKKTNGSFPSGHTTAVFAAATVFALEYKNKPLVPVISYTAATLVGLSRITENSHWATDVFVGAALGYICGRQVVDNYHRYAQVKKKEKKIALQFNPQYNFNHWEAGIICFFR